MKNIIRATKGLDGRKYEMKIWHGIDCPIYDGSYDAHFIRYFLYKRLPFDSKVVLSEERDRPFHYFKYIIETDCSNGFWKHVHIYISEKK